MLQHSQQKQKYLGVTPPISTASPTTKEVEITDKLVEVLKSHGLFESEEESKKREIVLGQLNQIFKQFVRRVSLKRGMPEAVANDAGGKIFTFGSYRLGVHGAGADIDTLCVAPKHVTRDDFFEDMVEALKARPEVTELTGVQDAYVPVIKFEFSGIPIDLVFATLGLPQVPDDLDLANDNLLKNLDERCVRSLNGSRVTDEILRLVPNIAAFRTALRCIKMWAKRRAIYSNVNGFLGGVAWAMLVARVCQLYPNAAAGIIVSKFFMIFYQWNWPQPVLLKPIEEGPLQVRVWNPKLYPADKAHRMPVITPAYPSMCATHNVTQSTQVIMTGEFKRAADIVDRIIVGSGDWNELFEKHDFFYRYKYYLQVTASSDSAERQLKWAGMVESRLRQLVMKLELVENLSLAHPFIKGFDKVTQCYSEQEAIDAAHGIFLNNRVETGATAGSISENTEATTNDNGNATATVTEGGDDAAATEKPVFRTVHTTTFYIGLMIQPRAANSTQPRKLDITWPTSEFSKMVKAWDKFDEKCMAIVIQYIKASTLPPDVFEGDEPKRKRSKSVRNRSNPPNGEKPSKKRRGSKDESVSTAATPSEETLPAEPEAGATSTEEAAGAAPTPSATTEAATNGTQSKNYSQVAKGASTTTAPPSYAAALQSQQQQQQIPTQQGKIKLKLSGAGGN